MFHRDFDSRLVCEHAVVNAGHGIFGRDNTNRYKVHGCYPGEESLADLMLFSSLELATKLGAALIDSGGRTRPKLSIENGVTNSEAEGMIQLMYHHQMLGTLPPGLFAYCTKDHRGQDRHWVRDDRTGVVVPVIKEEFARDSFENLFFSKLLVNARQFHVVSLGFKERRYRAVAYGLGHNRNDFNFHGIMIDDPGNAANMSEEDWLRKIVGPNDELIDPFLRAPEFAAKRAERTPVDLREPGAYLQALLYAYDPLYRDCRDRGVAHVLSEMGLVGMMATQMEEIRSREDWVTFDRALLNQSVTVSHSLLAA